MRTKRIDPWIAAVFVLAFLIMLAFNILSPIVSDDYAFCFGVDDQRIASIPSIIESLIQHRQSVNGRVFAHFFVYLFLWLPKSIFNVINASMSTICIWLLYRFWHTEVPEKNRLFLVTALAMIWYFLPGFGHVALWLTGSCNYLWGMVLFLAFIYQFYCVYCEKACALTGDKGKILQCLLCIPAAFFTGAYSENGSLSVIFILSGLIILMLFEKRKIPASVFGVLIALVAGFVFLMTAPAELHGRMGDTSLKSLFDSAKNCVLMTKKYCLVLLSIYSALLSLSIIKKSEKKTIIFSIILVLGGLISIAVFVFALYLPPRSFHVLVMNTILASILLLKELWEHKEKMIPSAFCGVMLVMFIFSFVLAAGDIVSLSLQADQREKQISEALESGETDVTLPRLISSTPYTVVVEEELSDSPDDWYNGCIAAYYGLDSVRAEFKTIT